MDATMAPPGDPRDALLELYDSALPQVYGYLLRRCDSRETAEELTSETFLAAVDAARRPGQACIEIGWLIGVARHKLADHWRRQAREQRNLRSVAAEPGGSADDPWDERLDRLQALDTLRQLFPAHWAVLTLRYLDDLPVAAVAEVLGRTVTATEGLLVRAKREFRSVYRPGEEDR